MTYLDSVLKSRDINSVDKCLYNQGYSLVNVCIIKAIVWLWELDRKEGRTPKNWCLRTVVLEKTPESPLDCKEIKPVNLKGDEPWIFTGRTDVEAEVSVFWSSDVSRQLIGKVPDAGKDWGQKEKWASEDEMAGQHHRCNEHELQQTPGDGERQGGLVCCSLWGCREWDMTGWLNNNSNELFMDFPSGSAVKNLPAMQELQGVWEDPLEEGLATHSNILSWRIARTEEPGRLQSTGSQRVRYDWSNLAHIHAWALHTF